MYLTLTFRPELTRRPERQYRDVERLTNGERTDRRSSPPRVRAPYGETAPSAGSSCLSAILVTLRVVHESLPCTRHGDVYSEVEAQPPCPVHIGMCPQSGHIPDYGPPMRQP